MKNFRHPHAHCPNVKSRVANNGLNVAGTGESGLSLVATLWILTILSVLATQFPIFNPARTTGAG